MNVMSQGLCARQCCTLWAGGWTGRGLSLLCNVLAEIHRHRQDVAATLLSRDTLQANDSNVSGILACTAYQPRLHLPHTQQTAPAGV